MLRLSAELELPIRPDSWFLGPIDWAGETQDYVDRVFRELVGQGLRPPPEQQRACAYAQCLVDQHMNPEKESEEESDEEL